MSEQLLADKMRPQHLSEVVGQEHLLAKGKLIESIVRLKHPTSLIFWGPPGSGKTTLARIIAHSVNANFVELSAVTAGKKDVVRVIQGAQDNLRLDRRTILFIDEIHRFNKAQQDAFLPYVENGTITLIGATTENPSFEVIAPLLSRCRVVTLKPLSQKDIAKLLKRTLRKLNISAKQAPTQAIDLIAELSGGDARTALNILEISLKLAGDQKLRPNLIESASLQHTPLHDKHGESHYNLVSAFIKSMRGGQATAALYYLARLLQAGDDPKFVARRMIIFASEDIGMAAPAALNLAVSTFLAVERIGMPECQYNLFHCATILSKAPKSRQVADAMSQALQTAKNNPDLLVPLHLRNAPTKLMQQLHYGQGYKWEAGFHHEKGFLPEGLDNIDFFQQD